MYLMTRLRTFPAEQCRLHTRVRAYPTSTAIELILERTHVLARSRHRLPARARRRQSSRRPPWPRPPPRTWGRGGGRAPAAGAEPGNRPGSQPPAGKPRHARTAPGYGRPAAAPGQAVPVSPRHGDTVPAVTAPRGPGRAVAPTAAVTGSHHASLRLPTRSHLVPRSRRPARLPPGRGLPARPRARSSGRAALPGGRPSPARRGKGRAGMRGKRQPSSQSRFVPSWAAQEPRRDRHLLLSRWTRGGSRRAQERGAGGQGGRPRRAAAGRARLPSGPARPARREPQPGASRNRPQPARSGRQNKETTWRRWGRRGAVAGRPPGRGAGAGGAGGRHSQEYGYSLKTVA